MKPPDIDTALALLRWHARHGTLSRESVSVHVGLVSALEWAAGRESPLCGLLADIRREQKRRADKERKHKGREK